MSKETVSRRRGSWIRRNQGRIAAVVIAAAAAAGAVTTPATAAVTSSASVAAGASTAQIANPPAGGVEDGTFRGTCLKSTSTTPPTKLLSENVKPWRSGIDASVVRILVPWDIASLADWKKATTAEKDHAQCLANYLTAAKKDHVPVEVSLNRSDSKDPLNRSDFKDPSVAAYRTAIKDLYSRTKRGSLISYLTAYNEPNNPGYFSDHHPADRSGRYYRIARQTFGGKVIAGDFAEGVSKGFLRSYIKAAGITQPTIWAIHPYTDITNFQYYLHDTKAHHTPRQAAQLTLTTKGSSLIRFATMLKNDGQGSSRIWLNEIYVDHRADRCPPSGPTGFTKKCVKKTLKKTGTTFSKVNQGYAALFLDGGLGKDSLPGYLAAHHLPTMGRYVYLRADTKPKPQANVLIIGHENSCLWQTLASHGSKPAAVCK